MRCPFCPTLEHLTQWIVYDKKIVVCVDLHKRGWDLRLLAVRYGEEGHKHWNKYSEEEKEEVRRYLRLGTIVMKGRGYTLVETDEHLFGNPEHGHIQGCFRRKKC